MEIAAKHSNLSPEPIASIAGKGPDRARRGGLLNSVGGKGAMLGAGLLGVLLGGLPFLAARALLYPRWAAENEKSMGGKLDLDLEVQPEYVKFTGRDGKAIGGWFVPAPPGTPEPWPCVLLIYGYGGFKEQMAGYARSIYEGGFATFMFDMSGSGLLKGQPVTFGFRERYNALDAANYLRTRPDVDPERLGVLGVSMGAATALLAAEADPGIKAIVSDSSYADLFGMVKPGIGAFVGPRAVMVAPLIVRYAELMVGMRSAAVRPDLAAETLGDRALFVIHGDSDPLTDPNSAQRLYEAASGPKELWIVPDCGHAYAPVVAPDEYKRRVNEFFQKYL